MKSRVGCSVLMMCMFCGFILNAQAEDTSLAAGRSLFDFGLKAAVSLPSFFWLEDNSWNGVTSLAIMPAAWAFVAVNLTDTVAVQVEGGYTGKGCRVSASDGKLLWLFN
ncbi:MAG: hypothetical protein JW852_01370, partial [Spirochaetales bacterium]|nr:hypothetical protein [Spirochaetales bacterium]